MIDLNKLKGTPKSVYELDKDLDLFIIKSNNDLSVDQETADKIRKYSL